MSIYRRLKLVAVNLNKNVIDPKTESVIPCLTRNPDVVPVTTKIQNTTYWIPAFAGMTLFCWIFITLIFFVFVSTPLAENNPVTRIELSKKEEALKREGERLNVLKTELAASIEKYTRVLEQIDNAIKELKETQNKNLRHISKAYEAMSPEDAAARLSNLDRTTAVKILLLMNSKKAGAVIGMMETAKAAQITKELAKASTNQDSSKSSR